MRVKLGYPDKIVEISGKMVYLFKERLYSAPLEEIVNYYLRGDGLLAPPLKSVAQDVVRVLMDSEDAKGHVGTWGRADQGVST